MAVEMLQEPTTIAFRSNPVCTTTRPAENDPFEPNFGADDLHAIKVIAYMMIGIFLYALVVYGVITLFAWLG